MRGVRCVRVSLNLTEDIRNLVSRAIIGGRYSSASEYVRALIVSERRQYGDGQAAGVRIKVPMGRPRAA